MERKTCLHNTALAVNPVTGDVAYPAGCIVVIYQPRRNRQSRYFRAGKAISCLGFSRDGGMLAVGERGHQPAVTVWNLATGAVLRELVGGHRFGVGCITFSPCGSMVATMGFKHDRMLRVWDLRLSVIGATGDRSPGARSAFPVGESSLDPDAPPPPLTHRDRTPGAPAPAPRRNLVPEARQVASARVSHRVRSMEFSADGKFLYTCGNGTLMKWDVPSDLGDALSDPEGFVDSIEFGIRRAKSEDDGALKVAPITLEGRHATIVEELHGETFVDLACSGHGEDGGGDGMVFSVTSGGILCSFSSDGILEKWVSLEVPVAHGLSLQDDSLAVACSNGLVRLFRASDLRYTTTLPRPPPLGYANISSVRELHELAAASTASGTSSGAVERDGVRGWGKEQPAGSSSCVDGSAQGDAEGVGSDLVHRYPATLGCRLSPSGTKVVCVYADRGLFIWDVTDPLCVGKYRSFLAHGGRIWDVQRMPVRVPGDAAAAVKSGGGQDDQGSDLPEIPDGAMLTCSADNTVRVWDLGALDVRARAEGHSGRWSNIYSKHLLRIMYTLPHSKNALRPDNRLRKKKVSADADNRSNSDASSPDGDDVVRNTRGSPGVSEARVSCEAHHPDDSASASDGALGDSWGMVKACAASSPPRRNGDARALSEDTLAAEDALSQGLVDPEMPSKPDLSCAPRSLAIHPDGVHVACGDKAGNILVYDMTNMELVNSQAAHESEVLSLAFSPVMVPATTSSMPVVPSGPASPPSPDSASRAQTVSANGSPTSGQVDADSKARIVTSSDAGETPGAAPGGTPGALVGASGQHGWDAIDPLAPNAAKRLMDARAGGGERAVELVLLASASRDRQVHVFDASANPHACRLASEAPASEGDTADVGFRGETEAGNQARRRDRSRSGEERASGFPLLKTLENHSGSVTAVRFSKDGKRLVSTGSDKMLVLNTVRGPHVQRHKTISVPQGTIFGLDVDPTNKYMVTAGQDKRLNIWSIATGRHVRGYKVEPSDAPSTVGTGGASAGSAGSAGSGVLGGVGGGGRAGTGGELFKVDLDPTGTYAAVCSFDKWIRVFDFYSGKCLAKVAGHSELATGVRFTSDGRRLVTIGGDGVMFVWRLSSELQQAMRDRMSELKASSVDPVVSQDHEPASSDRGRPGAGESLAAGGLRKGGTGAQASERVAEARARAKAEAKARLRFKRYQLPAWAHTQQAPALPSSASSIDMDVSAPSEAPNEAVMPPPVPTSKEEARAAGSSGTSVGTSEDATCASEDRDRHGLAGSGAADEVVGAGGWRGLKDPGCCDTRAVQPRGRWGERLQKLEASIRRPAPSAAMVTSPRLQHGAAVDALARSREEEDGVMLGGSGEDDDEGLETDEGSDRHSPEGVPGAEEDEGPTSPGKLTWNGTPAEMGERPAESLSDRSWHAARTTTEVTVGDSDISTMRGHLPSASPARASGESPGSSDQVPAEQPPDVKPTMDWIEVNNADTSATGGMQPPVSGRPKDAGEAEDNGSEVKGALASCGLGPRGTAEAESTGGDVETLGNLDHEPPGIGESKAAIVVFRGGQKSGDVVGFSPGEAGGCGPEHGGSAHTEHERRGLWARKTTSSRSDATVHGEYKAGVQRRDGIVSDTADSFAEFAAAERDGAVDPAIGVRSGDPSLLSVTEGGLRPRLSPDQDFRDGKRVRRSPGSDPGRYAPYEQGFHAGDRERDNGKAATAAGLAPRVPSSRRGNGIPGAAGGVIEGGREGNDGGSRRGRRIMETEGVVENMRRCLSAMGLLDDGVVEDLSDGVGGGVVLQGMTRAMLPGGEASVVRATSQLPRREDGSSVNESSVACSTAATGDGVREEAGRNPPDAPKREDSKLPDYQAKASKEEPAATLSESHAECGEVSVDEAEVEVDRGDVSPSAPVELERLVPHEACVAVAGCDIGTAGEGPLVAHEAPGEKLLGGDAIVRAVASRGSRDGVEEGAPRARQGRLPRSAWEYERALVKLREATAHAILLYGELTETSPIPARSQAGGVCDGPRSPELATLGVRRESGKPEVFKEDTMSDFDEDGISAIDGASESFGSEHEDEKIEGRSERTGGSLLKLFRESFASVHGVLSVAVSGEAGPSSGGDLDVLSVQRVESDRASGNRSGVQLAENVWETRSSTGEDSRTEAMKLQKDRTSGKLSGGRPDPALHEQSVADPGDRSRRWSLCQRKRAEAFGISTSRGDGASDRAVVGVPGHQALPAVDAGPGVPVWQRSPEEDALPPEVSDMLQRYSEMLLRMVQEKVEARLGAGALRPTSQGPESVP